MAITKPCTIQSNLKANKKFYCLALLSMEKQKKIIATP